MLPARFKGYKFFPGKNFKFWRAALVIGAVLCAILIKDMPFIRSLDNGLLTARFSISPQNKDFESVIIAIDTRSLLADPDWPWPRDRYAQLLENLNTAGAKQIAFDIDFSSRNEGDAEFGAAIGNSTSPVYLATYRQAIQGIPGAVAEIGPNNKIAGDALLATTVFPIGHDGIVRQMPAYDQFTSGPVPQLAIALNDHPPFEGLRLVDFAQDLRELPVISFQDVLKRESIEDIVRGKTVFVGATAHELGDEFAIPRHGLQSGVLLNVLAFESIRHGSEKLSAPFWATLLLVLIGVLFASVRDTNSGIRTYALINIATLMSIFLLGALTQIVFNVVIHTGLSHVAQLFCVAITLCIAADDYAAKAFRSNMNVRKHATILKTMMSSNHDGIILVNRLGKIDSCNERAAYLLGCDYPTMHNSVFEEMAPVLVETDFDNGPEVIDIQTLAGEPRFVEVSVSYVELPRAKSRYEKRREVRRLTLYTLHDQTARIQAEQSEREAKEMHARASAAKSTLISTMSHELRTPLNSVCGFADLISTEAFGAHTSPEYTEFGSMISSSGKQLLGVVNDMLLATQLQSADREINRRTFLIQEAVSAALERAQTRLSWSDPKIELDLGDAKISADYDLFVSAIYHLIDNASKFGGKDCTIWMSANADDRSFTIEDNGPGSGAATPEHMMGLFQQGDGSKTRSHEGCGLGLFLVNGIFELHGSSLQLAERPGGGFQATCAFSEDVWLPAAQVAAA